MTDDGVWIPDYPSLVGWFRQECCEAISDPKPSRWSTEERLYLLFAGWSLAKGYPYVSPADFSFALTCIQGVPHKVTRRGDNMIKVRPLFVEGLS